MAGILDQLHGLLGEGILAPIDYQFARFIARFEPAPEVVLAAAMVSQALGEQSSCVQLAPRCADGEAIPGSGIAAPALDHWRSVLQASDNVAADGESAPLILDGDRLYLSRFYQGERQLAASLLAAAGSRNIDEDWLQSRLEHYFGAAGDAPNWQKLAAALAMTRGFALITGGPGTGKTTTVVKIIALLLEQGDDLSIALAAPTGKAAARLSQSISDTLQRDPAIDKALAARIPTGVSTIHRLLRPIPNSVRFRHNAERPLACDVLLVDEASMIDTELMAALLSALKPSTRIILLGDRDQLPSVGVGQLVHDLCAELGPRGSDHALPYSQPQAERLGQLCGFDLARWRRPESASAIGDCIALLQTSYRFDPASGIGRLAQLVNTGDVAGTRRFMQALGTAEGRDVSCIVPDPGSSEWLDRLAQPWLRMQQMLEQHDTPVADKLAAQGNYRILCAVREGSGSVQQINRHIEQLLVHRTIGQRQGYYPGKPLMIAENNYSLQLYNGDSGVILRDDDGQLAAWFEGLDGTPRRLAISRLPAHETSYAISVHKSQGSEYRHVALVLPPSDPRELTPLISRELIYTAVTRASEQLTLACTTEVLCAGIQRRVHRTTGLAARFQS